MLWSNNVGRLTGYAMILLAACLVVGLAMALAVSDKDPVDRGEVQEFLVDIDDNQALAIIGTSFFVVLNAIGLLLAGLFYRLLRDRSRLLSITLFAGFVASSATGFVVEAFDAGMIALADSYANGGAGLSAGDPALLDLANILAYLSGATNLLSFTALGIALSSLGLIVWGAPEGRVNPPRLYGLAAMIAGLSAFLSWIVVATDIGLVFFAIQGIASLVFLLGMGGYLVMNPEDEETASA